MVLLREALRSRTHVQPLYVRAGLRWEREEIRALRRVLRALDSPRLAPLVILDLPLAGLYGRHWSTGGAPPPYHAGDASVYLPGRNVTLLALAATFCALRRIPLILSGLLAGNPYPDATPEFLRTLRRALALGLDAPIRIRAPFRGLSKADVIRRGRDLPLAWTLSCSAPRGGRHCGNCSKCGERAMAFARARVPDPTDYTGGPAASAAGRAGSVAGAASRTRVAAKRATSVR